LDENEALTPLGEHLAALPLDPRVAKALVYGALLGCLDPMLTVTAAMGFVPRPVMYSTPTCADRQADLH
jgi:ATP-dependent RNA helicase DHX57